MLTEKTRHILNDLYQLRNKRVFELASGIYPTNKIEIAKKWGVSKQYIYHLDTTFTQKDIRNIIPKTELE